MDKHKDSISWNDLVYGHAFIINFYEMFGLTPREVEGEPEKLKKSYREMMVKFHPDKYEHLAEVFRANAAVATRHIQLGYETLSDSQKRAQYDQLLESWKGPISDNPFPVYDPQFWREINQEPLTTEQIEEADHLVGQMLGYDAETHTMLERQVTEGNQDPLVERALDRSWFGKEVLAGLKEQLYWRQAGFGDREIPAGNSKAGYLEDVRQELAAAREAIGQRAEFLLLQARGGNIRLLTTAGEEMPEVETNPDLALAVVRLSLAKKFEESAPRIEALAEEQEYIRDLRLGLLRGEYRPPQRRLRDHLAVCITDGKKSEWFAVKLTDAIGKVAEFDSAVTPAQLSVLSDPSEARKWIRRGWSVMFLRIRQGMDVREQLTEAVRKHFDDFCDVLQRDLPGILARSKWKIGKGGKKKGKKKKKR